jgi:hypothetical protein
MYAEYVNICTVAMDSILSAINLLHPSRVMNITRREALGSTFILAKLQIFIFPLCPKLAMLAYHLQNFWRFLQQ